MIMLVALKYFCGAFALGVVVTLCGFGVMKVNEEYVPIAREYCESKARVFAKKKDKIYPKAQALFDELVAEKRLMTV